MFQNRKLLIATRHKKEAAIAPVMEKELGVICFNEEVFDTDSLGSFTGEIPRLLDPVSAAREKCLRAMELSGCDLAIASEGSFGPHPSLYFVPADDEILVLVDKLNGVEIVAREISTETNFLAATVTEEKDLLEFARNAGFPEHGLILRRSPNDHEHLFKGIREKQELLSIFEKLRLISDTVHVETDMRAMHNPMRMEVIRKASIKLAEKALSLCPHCACPGFAVSSGKEGLPCDLCGNPTRSILSHIWRCQRCSFEKEEFYPHGKTSEDPGFCDYCNP